MKTTITVERAAQLLGTTPMSIREIIAHNTLPIGIMLPKKKGQKRELSRFSHTRYQKSLEYQ